jgi:hypothetical protein
MIRRIITVLLAAALVLGGMLPVFALDGHGNARKGKYLYRKNCRSCHAEGKTAKDMSPVDHTQAQWKKMFDNYKAFPCFKDWKISNKDLNDIYSHLWGHAKDSPSPAKCK